jgi:multimeric flavodoxin WrbA
MLKMTIIIHGGHRNGLCFEAARYLQQTLLEKNQQVKFYNLNEIIFDYCCGNQPCQESGKCIYDDVVTNEIIPSVCKSDALVVFTPTYFNMPTTRVKNFIDRCNVMLTNETRKHPKFGAWVSGQTEKSSCEDNFKCLSTFAEICELEQLKNGKIIRVETDTKQTHINKDDTDKLDKLAKEIISL